MFKRKDYRTRFIVRTLGIYYSISSKLTTVLTYILCNLWKIQIESGAIFLGRTIFWRTPDSSIKIGKSCYFRSSFSSNKVGINRPCMISTLRHESKIEIGNNCGFSGTVISAAESIQMGSDVLCGANVTITDTDYHHISPIKRKNKLAPSSPVTIADNVWLGMNVLVLKGVSIGKNSVIAAGSIVTKDIPSNVIAAGQPAIVLRQLK